MLRVAYYGGVPAVAIQMRSRASAEARRHRTVSEGSVALLLVEADTTVLSRYGPHDGVRGEM